jgi:mannitol-specific phosphotransferase system IIBC component
MSVLTQEAAQSVKKSFNTDYEDEFDIANYAIDDLNAIAFLVLAKSYLTKQNNYEDEAIDINVSAFLSNALYDIAKGIGTCFEKKFKEKSKSNERYNTL